MHTVAPWLGKRYGYKAILANYDGSHGLVQQVIQVWKAYSMGTKYWNCDCSIWFPPGRNQQVDFEFLSTYFERGWWFCASHAGHLHKGQTRLLENVEEASAGYGRQFEPCREVNILGERRGNDTSPKTIE